MLADNCAYQLVRRPLDFDVVVACNQLGDVLSDLTAVYSGSLGMLPSCCLDAAPPPPPRPGDAPPPPVFGIFESTSGSAPDIAGLGVANPLGTILSVAMLCRYTLREERWAARIEAAVDAALEDGVRTRDLCDDGGGGGGDWVTTAPMTDCSWVATASKSRTASGTKMKPPVEGAGSDPAPFVLPLPSFMPTSHASAAVGIWKLRGALIA